jgi:predicted Zn finger-like uncharacterized protein
MPEVVNCPQCKRKLRVPDDLIGKKVKCPTCATTFTASAGAAPVPEEEAPRASRRPATPPDEDESEEVPRARRLPARSVAYDEEEDYEDEDEVPVGRRRPQEQTGNGMAVTGMVLGIVGFVIGFVPCFGWVGFILGILGCVFASIGLAAAVRTGTGKGMAVAGLVLSILSVVWIPLWLLIFLAAAAAHR